ncbi:RNA polymerase sigma factor [Bacteroidota bacterium]
MKLEEKIIIQEIKNRNKNIFGALFREYYPILIRFSKTYIFDYQKCEDIIQELFLHLWKHADSIQIHTSLKSYLMQAVKNRCMNYLRDLKIIDRHKLLFIEAFHQTNKDEIFDESLVIELNKAVKNLPPQMAKILWQKYYNREKIKDIAKQNNISKNTVKTQLQRAKNKLKLQLQHLANLFV